MLIVVLKIIYENTGKVKNIDLRLWINLFMKAIWFNHFKKIAFLLYFVFNTFHFVEKYISHKFHVPS
jgi:hypothetical protein